MMPSLPPPFPGLDWRTLTSTDLTALLSLAHACLLADGGLPFLFVADFLQSLYFPPAPTAIAALGAFDSQKRLVACAAVHADDSADPPRRILVGFVHPDLRRGGLGEILLRWSEAQAGALHPAASEPRRILQIRTESLTFAAERLYQAHGYEQAFAELVMQRDLDLPLPEHPLPDGLTPASWQAELAEQFYEAYYNAFKDRPGFPGWSADTWIGLVSDTDFKPAWSLLASEAGTPAGFVIGDVDLTADPPRGYIWQVGVVPAQRRRGLSSALLVESMRRMQQEGVPCAQLLVNINNPGAIEAYRRLDFKTIGCRARYERLD